MNPTAPSQISKKTEWTIFALAIIIQVLFIICFGNSKLALFAGFVFLIALIVFTAFSVVKVFILLAFYVSCFEIYGYLVYFPGFTLWYYWKISYPLFAILTTYWVIYLLRNREHFLLNQMDTAVVILISLMFLGVVQGFFRGYSRRLLFSDAMSQPFLLAYFIFLYSPLRNKIKVYYDFLLAFAIIVCFQFIYAVFASPTPFFLQRIVSIHIHITQFAIPYVIATLMYSTSRKRKFLFAILLPIIALGVVFSQQRALYAGVGLAIFFLGGLFLYSRRAWIKTNLEKVIPYSIATIIVLLIIFSILQGVTDGKFLLTLYSRLYFFSNIEQMTADLSLKIRWQEIITVFQKFPSFWLFGQGFGASFVTRSRYWVTVTLDNAYAYMIWKTGILGLLSLLYVYFIFFKRGLSTLRKNISTDERTFLTAALLNAAGMMLVAFSNCGIARYRLIFIWVGLFASTEAIARRYD